MQTDQGTKEAGQMYLLILGTCLTWWLVGQRLPHLEARGPPPYVHGKGSAANLRKEGSGKFILIAYFHPEGLVNWPSDGPAWMGAQKDLKFQGPASHSACED